MIYINLPSSSPYYRLAISILRQGKRYIDLPLIEALKAVFNAGPLEPGYNSRPVAPKALDDISYCLTILYCIGSILSLLPEEPLLLGIYTLLYLIICSARPLPLCTLLLLGYNKVPDKAALSKEYLDPIHPLQGAALMRSRLLLVRPRYIQLHCLNVPSEPSPIGQVLLAVYHLEAIDRSRGAVSRLLPRALDLPGGSQVVATE